MGDPVAAIAIAALRAFPAAEPGGAVGRGDLAIKIVYGGGSSPARPALAAGTRFVRTIVAGGGCVIAESTGIVDRLDAAKWI